MKKVFMIFAREAVEAGIWDSYSDKKFPTKKAAESYIKHHLEPEDKRQGIYEPDFYIVEDMTDCYN